MKRWIGYGLVCMFVAAAIPLLAQDPTPVTVVDHFPGSDATKYVTIFKTGNMTVTGTLTAGGISAPMSGAVVATTLSASSNTVLSGSVTVIGAGVTSRWDNAAGLIDSTKLAGNVAVARIATALTTPGASGGTTPAAGAFTGVTVGKASVASGVITMTGTTSGTATLTVADDGSAITANKPVSAALNGTGFIDLTATTTADDWSVSHYNITAGSGDNVRAFRATLTGTADSIKDLTAVHGRTIVPASATIDATGNSIQSVFGWTQIGASLTAGAGTVISANRAILTGGANDLRNIAGGGQSAIFHGMLWDDNSEIDSGIFFAIGDNNTIDSLIEVGGGSTVGTIIDLTSGGSEKDTLLTLLRGGPMDATETQTLGIFAGDSTDHATIHAEVGACSYGSLYISTAGELWRKSSAGQWESLSQD